MKLLSLLKSWFIEYFTPSPRYPSHARMQQLHDGEGEPITRAEWNLGAHYCPEFDYMFTFGERPEGGCYCRPDIGEYRATHKDHCLATHPANYEPCEHEFEPEPHGTRDTFVPPKCDDDFIREFDAALDAVTEEELERVYKTKPLPPIVTDKYPKAVHKHNDQWWFWEETHTLRYGPFNTEKEADDSLNRYCADYRGKPEAPEKDPVIEAWQKELKEGGLDTTPTDF